MGNPAAISKAYVSPKLIPTLVADGRFNMSCTFQARAETQSNTGSLITAWANVTDYVDLPCAKFDRLPHEGRTTDIIEELKYWTIMLGGYYPGVDDTWRIVINETSEIFDVIGIDSDSQHSYTIVTVRQFEPVAVVGV